MPGIGSNSQHQTVLASSLPARHAGAAPSRGGSWSAHAAAGRRERSCPGGKGPQGKRPQVPPRREIPMTAPADPGETPRVVVPAERGALPFRRAAVRRLPSAPRRERSYTPESRASIPAGGAPPSAYNGQKPVQPAPKRALRGVSPRSAGAPRLSCPAARSGEPGGGGAPRRLFL